MRSPSQFKSKVQVHERRSQSSQTQSSKRQARATSRAVSVKPPRRDERLVCDRSVFVVASLCIKSHTYTHTIYSPLAQSDNFFYLSHRARRILKIGHIYYILFTLNNIQRSAIYNRFNNHIFSCNYATARCTTTPCYYTEPMMCGSPEMPTPQSSKCILYGLV